MVSSQCQLAYLKDKSGDILYSHVNITSSVRELTENKKLNHFLKQLGISLGTGQICEHMVHLLWQILMCIIWLVNLFLIIIGQLDSFGYTDSFKQNKLLVLDLVQTASPNNFFLAYPDSSEVWTAKKPNWIQATFRGGLKCDSNIISIDVSQSGCSGHSNRISKCHLHHLQRDMHCDTQRRHEIQSHGRA